MLAIQKHRRLLGEAIRATRREAELSQTTDSRKLLFGRPQVLGVARVMGEASMVSAAPHPAEGAFNP